MKVKNLIVASVLGALHSGFASAGPLTGDFVDVAMLRTIDTGYGLGRITGYGLDSPFQVVEGDADKKQYSSSFTIDVDGAGFEILFISTAGWQDGIVLRLSDLDFAPGSSFSSFSLLADSNLLGYTLSFGKDFVDIGLGGTSYGPSTYFRGTFIVPEPSTTAILGIALAALTLTRTRRGLATKRAEA
ncbi:PEP-CTERM sorting domain-containing protein [Paucibacter sp. DJ2R-2]|uniref:PEP-CTERM sorting domain-containing protein n=1 Tax=Paucibacter sp. DJ2R-2 TaxID=2893558 RepID=UPI0021E3B276|nr:PEP-CTERM sorting domain-containing protein [Paucibacter sp. DJ2R-2]MCV2419420.1 PEP-CTERM sorting domain-containing protein [Paucibacter sp. DJ4R-1]MCV2437676.1 PEP-CTERM sorting domain-containing protein [Paucibacter sp. DJ2R-2]